MDGKTRAKEAENRFPQEIRSIGFSAKYGVSTLRIGDAFLAWVGVNIGVHAEFIRLNVNVGVHCQPVMKLIDEACGEKYFLGKNATIATPLAELVSDPEIGVIKNDQSIDVAVGRMVNALREEGLLFANGIASYPKLMELLKKRVANLGHMPERYVVAAYIFGEGDSVNSFIDNQIGEYATMGLNKQAQNLAAIKHLLQTRYGHGDGVRS